MNKFKKGDQVKLTSSTYINDQDWLGEIVNYDKVKSDKAVDKVYNVLWIYLGKEELHINYNGEPFMAPYNEISMELVK